jgi:septal ring-binding cell division protein DamX
VDFWKGKITAEEEDIEEDEDVDEPENPMDTLERRPDSSRGTLELVNTRLSGETSSNTRDSTEKIVGNGGLRSAASAHMPSQPSRKSGLSSFLALTSRYPSNKDTVVTRTTGSCSTNTESSRPLDQERLEAPASSVSDHIELADAKNEVTIILICLLSS